MVVVEVAAGVQHISGLVVFENESGVRQVEENLRECEVGGGATVGGVSWVTV